MEPQTCSIHCTQELLQMPVWIFTRHRDGKYVSKALLQTALIILYFMLSTVNMRGTSQKNRGRVGRDNTALRHAL